MIPQYLIPTGKCLTCLLDVHEVLCVGEEDPRGPGVGLYEGQTAGHLFLLALVQGEEAREEEGHQSSHHGGGVYLKPG